jgi:hypothetical protein
MLRKLRNADDCRKRTAQGREEETQMTASAKTLRATVRVAERLLREDAQCTYESCRGVDTPWVCGGLTCPNCPAHKGYSARIRCANQLTRHAAATKAERGAKRKGR